jgi:hypothetical protein
MPVCCSDPLSKGAAMANDLTAELVQAATDPQSQTADGQTAVAKRAADLILLDQYLAAKSANQRRGLRFNRMIGPQQCVARGPLSDGLYANPGSWQ